MKILKIGSRRYICLDIERLKELVWAIISWIFGIITVGLMLLLF